MLKFGVHRLQDLHPRLLDTRMGRRKFVAVTLYPQVSRSPHPDRDRLLQLILCRFAGANQVFKRTYRHRFGDFDREIARLIRESRFGESHVRVHDVAVSNGVTAVDFYRLLRDCLGERLTYLASDFAPDVVAISQPNRKLTLVLDPRTREWLQLVYPPFVFNLQKRENAFVYPVNSLIRGWLLQTQCQQLWRQYCEQDSAVQVERIELLHPDCQQLLQDGVGFHFQRCDIRQPMEGPFDVVRAMNILHVKYFVAEELRAAIRHIHASLTPGGLFATGSNQDENSPVDGAVYRKSGHGFKRLFVTGTGSPVDTLITEPLRGGARQQAA